MMTTKITVPAHIREYITGKYGNFQEGPVSFPDNSDIYHTIYDLLERRPVSVPVDKGNLEICLPNRTAGKSPKTYNFLGVRSQLILNRKFELMMWAELHDMVDEQKHRYGVNFIVGIHAFMNKYGIASLSEDAFLKNYYRWRGKIRPKEEKRPYTRKN